MPAEIPLSTALGLELHERVPGICAVTVLDPAREQDLSWDRFVRLKAAAAEVRERDSALLDVGGFDGALAFFLPGTTVDVIDPATTGGSIHAIPCSDSSYRTVVAVDVLEHVEPAVRESALAELARACGRHLILNYPCRASLSAQKIALQLTGNELIRQHVEWELPDTDLVMAQLRNLGFDCTFKPHTSIATWLGQYVTLHTVPDGAPEFNRYLVENHAAEPFGQPLYHLVVGERHI